MTTNSETDPPFASPHRVSIGMTWILTALTLHGGLYLVIHHGPGAGWPRGGDDNLLAQAAGLGTAMLILYGSSLLAGLAGRLTLGELRAHIPRGWRQPRPPTKLKTPATLYSPPMLVVCLLSVGLGSSGAVNMGLVMPELMVGTQRPMPMPLVIGFGTAGLLCWTAAFTMIPWPPSSPRPAPREGP